MKTVILAIDIWEPKWGNLCQEWESKETVDYLAKTIEELGFPVIKSDSPKKLIQILNQELEVGRTPLVWNGVEGFGSRNRESYAPCLAEFLGIPHSGSDAFCQAITLDKKLTKEIGKNLGIPVSSDFLWKKGEDLNEHWNEFPAFIKPNAEGSSLGVSSQNIISNKDELRKKGQNLHLEFEELLVEPFLTGRELTIGILGNCPEFKVSDSAFVAYSGLIYSDEIKSKEKMPETLDFGVPKELNAKLKVHSLNLAKQLKVSGYARLDYRLDSHNNPFFLEINCTPGLSFYYSTFPKLWRELSYQDLISSILSYSWEEGQKHSRFEYGKRKSGSFVY